MHIDFDGTAAARNYPAPSRADAKPPAANRASANPRASFGEISAEVEAQTEPASAPHRTEQTSAKPVSYWENGDFGFGDILDTINPLQHLPIVATLYRNMTGDRIGMVPRVIGGALWGRIGGFVSGLLNAAVEWFTGKDLGDHVYAFLHDKIASPESVQTASEGKSPEASGEPLETTESARHARARGPLFTRGAFEDLSVYQAAEAETTYATVAAPPSFSSRRLRVSA
jgi:hypothetical protein